ncbi:hypothetical protein OPT61_g1702 [Boeremia exigua]|uniref:Uncharacterized protein n=1 Tax=Boeremia exigua TaxID=749465 RepID=A0ACC2IP74_9PLEO|nr:hypothetical protein OPT61_g1702 [Boeremia exigua]
MLQTPLIQDLEDAAFAHFDRHRDEFSLHFHLESHDRCEVKLKPKLWDKGAYFMAKLLVDETLRLIPHFSAKQNRNIVPQKRFAPHLEPIGASVGDLHCAKKAQLEPHQPHNVQGTAELDPEDDKHFLGTNKYSSCLDVGTWSAEFERQKQVHLDTRGTSIDSDPRSVKLRHISRIVHRTLIEGDYGLTAPISCENCIRVGGECRVYHPDCYEWKQPGRGMESDLGWRCARCRLRQQCVFPDVQSSKPSTAQEDSDLRTPPPTRSIPYTESAGDNVSEQSPRRNKYSAQVQLLNHVPPISRKPKQLPASVTPHTWANDFEIAKQKYLSRLGLRGGSEKSQRDTVYVQPWHVSSAQIWRRSAERITRVAMSGPFMEGQRSIISAGGVRTADMSITSWVAMCNGNSSTVHAFASNYHRDLVPGASTSDPPEAEGFKALGVFAIPVAGGLRSYVAQFSSSRLVCHLHPSTGEYVLPLAASTADNSTLVPAVANPSTGVVEQHAQSRCHATRISYDYHAATPKAAQLSTNGRFAYWALVRKANAAEGAQFQPQTRRKRFVRPKQDAVTARKVMRRPIDGAANC